ARRGKRLKRIAAPRPMAQPRCLVDRHHRPPERPEGEAGELQMRPGEREADDGDGEADRSDEMAEGEPPSGEKQPDEVADRAERPGAEMGAPGQLVAPDDGVAEGQ